MTLHLIEYIMMLQDGQTVFTLVIVLDMKVVIYPVRVNNIV